MKPNTQKPQRKNLKLLALFMMLFAGCSKGAHITVCVVDAVEKKLLCSDEKDNETIQPLADQVCTSTAGAELFLKRCKYGVLPDIPECYYRGDHFKCTFLAKHYEVPFTEVDGYICLSKKDWERVKQRC